jgi:hypothetical protein
MPKQKGIIKLKGSMGGITFYQKNGEHFSRETNGPDKNKIKHDPAFQRTRENNQEFGGAAQIGKAFRTGLVKDFDEMSDSSCTARITKLIKQIISKGEGKRGQRDFSPNLYGEFFLYFAFNESVSFNSILLASFTASANATRNEVTITIPDFNTGNMVHAPAGASHFRIINLISILSEYKFNETSQRYEPTDPDSNSLNAFNASNYIALGGNVGSDTIIVSTITPVPAIESTSILISCIGIEFYQKVGSEYYLLASNNSMKVQAVY